jgi:hypothetical protein
MGATAGRGSSRRSEAQARPYHLPPLLGRGIGSGRGRRRQQSRSYSIAQSAAPYVAAILPSDCGRAFRQAIRFAASARPMLALGTNALAQPIRCSAQILLPSRSRR